MRLFLSIPLFAWLLAIMNVLMLARPLEASLINVVLGEFALPSGRPLVLTVSDALILSSVACLYLEIFKATRTSAVSIIDHSLSLIVFVVFLIEFLVVEQLGNTTFLIVTVMAFVDVVSGFTVTISTARRDFTVGS